MVSNGLVIQPRNLTCQSRGTAQKRAAPHFYVKRPLLAAQRHGMDVAQRAARVHSRPLAVIQTDIRRCLE